MDKQLNKVPMLNDEPAAEYSVARKPLSIASEQLLGEHGVALSSIRANAINCARPNLENLY
nr:hypothetical protein [Yersinia pestis]